MKLIDGADELLHRSVAVVTDPLDVTADMIDDMRGILGETNGVGLSANQVGLDMRFFVIAYGGREMVCINPEIVLTDAPTEIANEGCLSYMQPKVPVRRFTRIKVRYTMLDGTIKQHYMNGWLARIYQHELDHLNGITINDRTKELN